MKQAVFSNYHCHIYLVRHGQTDWNVQGRVQSQTDVPLNDWGKRQAEELRHRLRDTDFVAAYSSDLSRAKQTAEIILGQRQIPLIETSLLREAYLGFWEGKPLKEFTQWLHLHAPPPHCTDKEEILGHRYHCELESYSSIFERFKKFILSYLSQYSGETVLVCSHAGVIMSLLHYLDFCLGRQWQVANGGYIHLYVTPSSIELVNADGVCAIDQCEHPED